MRKLVYRIWCTNSLAQGCLPVSRRTPCSHLCQLQRPEQHSGSEFIVFFSVSFFCLFVMQDLIKRDKKVENLKWMYTKWTGGGWCNIRFPEGLVVLKVILGFWEVSLSMSCYYHSVGVNVLIPSGLWHHNIVVTLNFIFPGCFLLRLP